MKQMPGSDGESKNSSSLPPNAQRSNPYGPPGKILPAGQPPTFAPYPYSQSYQAGGVAYPQPAGPSAAVPAAFPAAYWQQGVGNAPNPAVSFNANSPEKGDSTSQRLPVVLLIIGIVIASAYLVFLLLVLVKPDILALPVFPSQPVSITADAEQLLASSPIGLW